MLKYLPELAWDNIEIKKVKSYKSDSADYQVKISYRNTGKLPTALKQAALVKIVASDRVVIEIIKPQNTDGKPVYKIIGGPPPQGDRGGRGGFMDPDRTPRQREISRNVPFTQGGATNSAVIEIRVYSGNIVTGKASVLSTRGGVLRDKEFIITNNKNNEY
jgi:hypothetical protein